MREAMNIEQRVAQALEELESTSIQRKPVRGDSRPLDERPTACRVCGVATEPGDGTQEYTEKWRSVRGGRESYDVPAWKTCQTCIDERGGPRMWGSWLGLTGPLNLDALAAFAAEYPVPRYLVPLGAGRVLPVNPATGPMTFEEDGGHAGAPGGRRWMHSGAVYGRREAKARWRELIGAWSDEGSQHPSGEPCGVCGRTHAWPALPDKTYRPAVGVAKSDRRVRWAPTRVLGGKVACSVCYRAYRQRTATEFAEGTVADWAAAQAAGLYPVVGLAAEIRFALAYQHPTWKLAGGSVRGPWVYLGPELARLREWAASLVPSGPGDLPDLPVAGVLKLPMSAGVS